MCYGISGTYAYKLHVLVVCEMVEISEVLEEVSALFLKV